MFQLFAERKETGLSAAVTVFDGGLKQSKNLHFKAVISTAEVVPVLHLKHFKPQPDH